MAAFNMKGRLHLTDVHQKVSSFFLTQSYYFFKLCKKLQAKVNVKFSKPLEGGGGGEKNLGSIPPP